ncbi:hypothetical protein JOY40_26835 [Bacillus tropicus]|nr:hypothetical protein [Bacillus cereus group sp. TH243-3LC]MCU4864210.1 hypothetical protein [Bacillus cereus]MDA1553347.1 hypothetical protein [Bacillus cereus group sp. TH243-3LC]
MGDALFVVLFKVELPAPTIKTDWLAVGRARGTEYASTRTAPLTGFLFIR